MHSTRRLLDRCSSVAFLVFLCATGALASASCTIERGARPDASEPDASFDASHPNEDADAGPFADAAPFDGGLLPIECTSPPCATALVAGKDESFCALLHDGTVACWGDNQLGQLGRGEASSGSATPTRIPGLIDIVALDRTCAVDKAGAAFCWGQGPYRGADAGVTTELEPVRLDIPPAKKVSASARTACAIVDSDVLCWGSNASGQVSHDEPSDTAYPPTPIALGPGSPIRDLTVNEATFIVREDGASESWGRNLLLARESSLSPDPNPRATMFDRLTAVDVAEGRACAAAGGDAYCWGDDVGATPRRVVTPEPVVQVATTKTLRSGTIVTPARWCAVSASGAVYCSGNNTSGQAGDGTREHAARPVKVAGLPAPAARVKTTYDATCALMTNGKIYCVGSNYYGQLGNGIMRRSSLEPVEVRLP